MNWFGWWKLVIVNIIAHLFNFYSWLLIAYYYINFNMSESEQLIQIINNVLQPNDPNLRKQSEEILNNLRSEKPNELVCAYLEILKGNIYLYSGQNPMQCRNFAASQLRLCLSNFSPATYTNLWDKLRPEVQGSIKVGLFEIIYLEPDLTMKKHLADTIG